MRGQEARRRPESTPSSFRRKPESSGLFNTFPPGREYPSRASSRHSAGRRAPEPVYHRVIALLDSGLRRNDDETVDAFEQPYSLNPCLHTCRRALACMPRAGWNNDRGVVRAFRHSQDSIILDCLILGCVQAQARIHLPPGHSGAGPPAWMQAYRDVGGRTAPACYRQG